MNIQRLLLSAMKPILSNRCQQAGRQIGKTMLLTVWIASFVPLVSVTYKAWASADDKMFTAETPPSSPEQPRLDITQSLLLGEDLGADQSALPCEVLELDITQSLLLSQYAHK